MLRARSHPARRGATLAALVALLGAVSLVLCHCTSVSESVTGLRLEAAGPATCVKQCNNLFKSLSVSEQKRHMAEIERCMALSQPDKDDCLVAENDRHQATMLDLSAGKVACQDNCHHLGAESGG